MTNIVAVVNDNIITSTIISCYLAKGFMAKWKNPVAQKLFLKEYRHRLI